MTQELMKVTAEDLLCQCFVIHHSVAEKPWLLMSPLHFFVKYQLPSLISPWSSRTELSRRKVPACKSCNTEHANQTKFMTSSLPCLRAFDPFAGVGAFGMAMEQSECVKVTHAVEISPSATSCIK